MSGPRCAPDGQVPDARDRSSRALVKYDCVAHNGRVQVRFSQSARRHRIGKAHTLHVMNTTEPKVTPADETSNERRLWIGPVLCLASSLWAGETLKESAPGSAHKSDTPTEPPAPGTSDEELSVAFTPKQLAIGFGIIASLVLIVAGRMRRRSGR